LERPAQVSFSAYWWVTSSIIRMQNGIILGTNQSARFHTQFGRAPIIAPFNWTTVPVPVYKHQRGTDLLIFCLTPLLLILGFFPLTYCFMKKILHSSYSLLAFFSFCLFFNEMSPHLPAAVEQQAGYTMARQPVHHAVLDIFSTHFSFEYLFNTDVFHLGKYRAKENNCLIPKWINVKLDLFGLVLDFSSLFIILRRRWPYLLISPPPSFSKLRALWCCQMQTGHGQFITTSHSPTFYFDLMMGSDEIWRDCKTKTARTKFSTSWQL